jgi:alpha-D-ribose 1-methylphosphonate 5-triphosphate synthase subunit PhnH
LVREVHYDEVFDSQRHFRSLLDSVARPGKINRLDPVPLDPPPGLNSASVLVAFALMDATSTFHAVCMDGGEGGYLASNTGARRAEIEDAHFLFTAGDESPDFLDLANCGDLLYPDTAATVILQVAGASTEPLTDALKLTLEGPGIDGTATLFVRGLSAHLLLALQARNAEFPMGLDSILTFVDGEGRPCVAALPRTTRVSWENC